MYENEFSIQVNVVSLKGFRGHDYNERFEYRDAHYLRHDLMYGPPNVYVDAVPMGVHYGAESFIADRTFILNPRDEKPYADGYAIVLGETAYIVYNDNTAMIMHKEDFCDMCDTENVDWFYNMIWKR